MQYDRQVIISTAANRKSKTWLPQQNWISELVEKLKTPVRSTETLQEYLKLSKAKQDDLKDVGGFVAGSLKGNKRGSNTVIGRDIITLDLDNIPSGETQNTLLRLEGLGCGYAVYSTRKHEPVKPRLRVLLPLNRTCTADEYEPIARKIASIIGIELCDPTTFQASRLMYWPSCCSDSPYVFQYGDRPFLDADGILNLYTDWRNITEWAQVPGAPQAQVKLALKQSDPESKTGVVGAFCKVYDIFKAIDTFIPDAYTTCDMDDRLTYTGGSTTAGAIVYDNGKFLYSHHATDPAGGKLCNSFDLIRMHLFSEADEDAKPDTPTNKLPSYTEMCKLAVGIKEIQLLLDNERYERAAHDFQEGIDDSIDWKSKLSRNSTTGAISKTVDNVFLIIENDPKLKGKIAYDEFSNRSVAFGPFPWDKKEGKREWTDIDDTGLWRYLDQAYGISNRNYVVHAVSSCAYNNSFDDVKAYLTSNKWDGIERLDTLLIDYLGAEDNIYTRELIRKSLIAAVARVMTPGCKYDFMPIIVGPQGIGKSTFLKTLGKDWFSDSLQTFEGKEAAEMIQGTWINEVGELDSMKRSEITAVKQFLSRQFDIFREAYGRRTGRFPRRSVFFGTTNESEFLKDETGNRRFWPVDIGINQLIKNVHTELENEVDQIWAEAFTYWQLGESLYLSEESKEIAENEQESHKESNPKEGLIREFIEKEVPVDWYKRDLNARIMYWNNNFTQQDCVTVKRDRICAAEIWCECFNSDLKFIRRSDVAYINSVVSRTQGWEKAKDIMRFGCYGRQRGFVPKLY